MNDVPQSTQQSTKKPQQSSSIRNSSIYNSEPAQKHILQSEPKYSNNQSQNKAQLSMQQSHIPSQYGLYSLVTIVNNFKVWEENFQDPQEDRTSVIALVEEKDNQQQDSMTGNSLANVYNSDWVNVMNSLIDSYGERVDYFYCTIKNRDQINQFKAFPSIIVYKGGQKVMEISLQNQAKTILRLLERFLNTASGMLTQSAQSAQRTSGNLPQNQHPQALLLMEQSVQQTECDCDLITIPANIPNQRELLNLLDVFVANNQIKTLDYFIFKCKILETFDLFMRNFFEMYRQVLFIKDDIIYYKCIKHLNKHEFDRNSFKDYIIQLANQQNTQDKLDVNNNLQFFIIS